MLHSAFSFYHVIARKKKKEKQKYLYITRVKRSQGRIVVLSFHNHKNIGTIDHREMVGVLFYGGREGEMKIQINGASKREINRAVCG